MKQPKFRVYLKGQIVSEETTYAKALKVYTALKKWTDPILKELIEGKWIIIK